MLRLPVVLARPALEWWGSGPARCGASGTGARDRRQMMSVRPAGRWGFGGLCRYPRGRRLAVLREAVCGCGAGTGQGSLSLGAVLACRAAPLGCKGCLGPSAGRMVGGGSCMCRRGSPPRMAAPGGVLTCRFPRGLRDLLGPWSSVSRGVSPVARGSRDGPDVVPLHGCTDAQGRVLVHRQCSLFISSGL